MSADTLPATTLTPPPPLPERSSGGISTAVFRPTQIEKAAIILSAVGPDKASEILADLNETGLLKFARAVTGLRNIPPAVFDGVLEEFYETLGGAGPLLGGSDNARKILSQVLDEASVAQIMAEIEGNSRRSIWDQMMACSDAQLAGFLKHEHPQTVAMILSEVRSDKAAAVLERLDADFAQTVVLRLSRIPRIDLETRKTLEDIILRDFLSALQRENATRKPPELIASLMNNVSSEGRDRFLAFLEEKQPDLAYEVQRVMFTFKDIVTRVAGRDVAIVVRNVEEEVLMIALKSGLEAEMESAEFILSNISKRLAERFREEIAAMPEVRQKDADAAQATVVQTIQERVKMGELVLNDPEPE